jgi:hypothetical protein
MPAVRVLGSLAAAGLVGAVALSGTAGAGTPPPAPDQMISILSSAGYAAAWLLLALVILVMGALAWALWPGPSAPARRPAPPPWLRRRSPLALMAGLAAFWLLLAFEIHRRQGASNGALAGPYPLLRVPAAASRAAATGYLWLTLLLVTGVLAAVGLFAARALLRHGRAANQPFEPTLDAALADSLVALSDPADARGAVIASYARMEAAAAASGHRRRPAETPAEFMSAFLRRSGASTGPVARLTDLFQRAAFSAHPVRPEDAAAAREALETVRSELASGPGAGR